MFLQSSIQVLLIAALFSCSTAVPSFNYWTTKCDIPGQVFTPCKAGCNPTCDNLSPICTLACIPGCHCPTGTALEDGCCISAKYCERYYYKPDKTCTIPGQVYTNCGTACPPTCYNYYKIKNCTKQCVRGCQCPRGTVLHQNECISRRQCPKYRIKYNSSF